MGDRQLLSIQPSLNNESVPLGRRLAKHGARAYKVRQRDGREKGERHRERRVEWAMLCSPPFNRSSCCGAIQQRRYLLSSFNQIGPHRQAQQHKSQQQHSTVLRCTSPFFLSSGTPQDAIHRASLRSLPLSATRRATRLTGEAHYCCQSDCCHCYSHCAADISADVHRALLYSSPL